MDGQIASKRNLVRALLAGAMILMNGCTKPKAPPGKVLADEILRKGAELHPPVSLLHPAIIPVPIVGHPKVVRNPESTIIIGDRTIHLDSPLSFFRFGDPDFPADPGFALDVRILHSQGELTKHINASTKADESTYAGNDGVDIRIGAWKCTVPPPVTNVVIAGRKIQHFSDACSIRTRKVDFSRGFFQARGFWAIDEGSPTFDNELTDALIWQGYWRGDVANALKDVKLSFASLTARESLLAMLASDRDTFARETDLRKALRQAYLQWDLVPVWAISMQAGGHELMAFESDRKSYLGSNACFEEFDEKGAEIACGTINLTYTPTPQELADEIATMFGEMGPEQK